MNLIDATHAARLKLDVLSRLFAGFVAASKGPAAASKRAAECRQAVATAKADAFAGGVALDPGALERLRSDAARAEQDASLAADVEADLAARLERESASLAGLEAALSAAGSEVAGTEAPRLLAEARAALGAAVQRAAALLLIPNRGGLEAALSPILGAASALGIEIADQRSTPDAKAARDARAEFDHLGAAREQIREMLEARRSRLRRAAQDAADARAREHRFGSVA